LDLLHDPLSHRKPCCIVSAKALHYAMCKESEAQLPRTAVLRDVDERFAGGTEGFREAACTLKCSMILAAKVSRNFTINTLVLLLPCVRIFADEVQKEKKINCCARGLNPRPLPKREIILIKKIQVEGI